MIAKLIGAGVAILILVGVAIWVNDSLQTNIPDGYAAGNGRLELQRLDVATMYPGRVLKLFVEEGQNVEQDTPLAELSSEQTASKLAAAQAAKQRATEAKARAEAQIIVYEQQLRVAELDVNNTRSLYNKSLVSSSELNKRQSARDAATASVNAAKAGTSEAQAAINQAQANIDEAASANNEMLIVAPKASRVEYRIAELGNVLGAGQRVITLVDTSDITMSIFLPTNTIGKLHVGDEARIVLDGIDAVWPATVSYIASEAQFTPKYVETSNEREKLMYKVKLRIPKETALQHTSILKDGMTGNGYVRTVIDQEWPSTWQVRLPK